MEVLQDACKTGKTAKLAHLISENKFPVNENLSEDSPNQLPLVEAINCESLLVMKLLLDNGADPNLTFGEALLTKAVKTRNIKVVKLLIERGADHTQKNFQALRMALKLHRDGDKIWTLLLNLVTPYVNNKSGVVPAKRKVGRCAQLIEAIFKDDAAEVTKLLEAGGYTSYAGAMDDREYRPALLAYRNGNLEVIEAFIDAGVDLTRIYFEAAEKGNVEVLELCLNRPGFDPDCRNLYYKETALHVASVWKKLEVIKILIGKYGLKLNPEDRDGKTPLHHYKPDNLRTVLAEFPELRVKVPRDIFINHCDIFAVLLEHGTYKVEDLKDLSHEYHDCSLARDKLFSYDWPFINKPKKPLVCFTRRHLQKLQLVDPHYVESIIDYIRYGDTQDLKNVEFSFKKECEEELVKMRTIRISQGTSTVRGKSLHDLFYLTPNEAARYSRNQILLKIYKDNNQNFQKVFPHYGFDLNRQLRRGKIRRSRLDSAVAMLCYALGTGLFEDFAELVFGNFSNSQLQQFSLDSIENSV